MTQCVYCNRPAVKERTEAYVINGVEHKHVFSHCECCQEDFVTPQQEQLNLENRSKP